MHAVQNKTTHPKGLWPLSLCYALFMWTFGYLVSALNLYFIHYIPNSASQADNYTYTFLALLWILPIAGGYMAQRCGYFTAAISGLCFCIVGTIGLTFSGQINLTLFVLSCFLTGNALFTPSLWCLVDHLYHKDDPRRESGFTLFYLLFNLGCVAGIFTENQINATAGYAAAFAVCSALLLGTLLLLQHFKKIIKQTSSRCPAPQLAQNQSKLYYTLFSSCGFSSVLVSLLFFYSSIATYLIYFISALAVIYLIRLAKQQPHVIQKKKVYGFLVLCLFAVGFWVLYNLESSLLSVFIENTVNRHIALFGFQMTLPAESFFGFESLAIVLIGLFLSNLWLYLAKKGKDPSLVIKFSLAILLIASGYLYLPIVIQYWGVGNRTPAVFILISYLFFASGELCIGPLGISMVGKLSPQGNEGTLMGIWQLVIGVSAIVGSQIATHARVEFSNIVTQQHSYVNLFNRLGLTMMIAGAAVLLISRHVKALLDEAKDEHTHANEPANQNA